MSTTDGQTAQLPIWSWATSTCFAFTARTSAAWARSRAKARTRLSLSRQVWQCVCVCVHAVQYEVHKFSFTLGAETPRVMCHIFCSDLWGSTKFACPPTLLHRPGAQTNPLQGEGGVLCAQVHSAPGWQICSGRLQHCHQLRRQRLP